MKARALRTLALLLTILTLVFSVSACQKDQDGSSTDTSSVSESVSDTEQSSSDETILGEGAISYKFKAIGSDGSVLGTFVIRTDKATVGESLLDAGLIVGDAGPYGLYVKTVCGEHHDYEVDGKYWAFYINGEYAMTGVDSTDAVEGSVYEFKAE